MKREEVNGFIAYLLIILVAVVFGLTVLRAHQPESQLGNLYYAYIIGAILTGVLLNAIMFEVAHVIGAKIGRYNILSCCVLGFTFYKVDGKTKFRFKGFEGLTGETKIFPVDGDKQSNPRPFLLGGTVWFVIELVATIISFSILISQKSNYVACSNAAYFILTVAVIGGMIYVYNIIPIQLDVITDGYRLRTLSNPKNREAFNELLKVEQAIAEGRTDVEIKTFTEITNFTADLNLNKVYVLLDKKDFVEAEKLLDIILEGQNGMSRKVYLRARAQKIYINLMYKNIEEAKQFYDTQVSFDERRELASDVSMPSIRAYLLMSGLLDKSRSECIIALNNIFKAYKHTSKNRRPVERVLFNEALEKVSSAHKDWELDDYKLVEETKK